MQKLCLKIRKNTNGMIKAGAVNKFSGSAWQQRVEGHFSGGGRMQMSVCPVITAGMFAGAPPSQPTERGTSYLQINALKWH